MQPAIERNPDLPPAVNDLCMRCLAKDPAQRFATATELGDVIRRLQLEGQSTGAKFASLFASRKFRLAVGMVAALVVVTAVVLLPITGPFWPHFGETTNATATPKIRMQVWRDEKETDWTSALPLRSGDRIGVSAELPLNSRPALFWLDSEGNVAGPLQAELIATDSALQLVFPNRKRTRELVGPSGTEVMFICASYSNAPTIEDVQDALTEVRPWPSLPVHEWVIFDQSEVKLHGSRGLGAEHDRPGNAVLENAQSLRRELAKKFDVVLGIAFPHRE